MNNYVTGKTIRNLREARGLTQETLAADIHVSAKAVSKWETGKGFPDVSLLEPLAASLGISVIELLSGSTVRNRNRAANMLRSRLYVCPVCGNVVQAAGEAVISCCGIILPPQEAEEADDEHRIQAEIVDGEYYLTLQHPMTKVHYISFLLAVSDRGTQLVKLYPEENAETRFRIPGVKVLYAYCNRHGLFQYKLENAESQTSPRSKDYNDILRRKKNMKELIGYCGLDCEACEARTATVKGDDALRRKVALRWSALNGVEITPEMIHCTGCRVDGPKTPYCESLCPIRQCALERRAETCGSCGEMDTCEKLAAIIRNNPEAAGNLKG